VIQGQPRVFLIGFLIRLKQADQSSKEFEMQSPEDDAHLMNHAVVSQLNLIHAARERFPINLD
jgi:hypothetical protein